MAEKIVNPYWRIFIVGIVLSILLLLCHGGRYAGLGTNLIAASFSGQTIYLYDFIANYYLQLLLYQLDSKAAK